MPPNGSGSGQKQKGTRCLRLLKREKIARRARIVRYASNPEQTLHTGAIDVQRNAFATGAEEIAGNGAAYRSQRKERRHEKTYNGYPERQF